LLVAVALVFGDEAEESIRVSRSIVVRIILVKVTNVYAINIVPAAISNDLGIPTFKLLRGIVIRKGNSCISIIVSTIIKDLKSV